MKRVLISSVLFLAACSAQTNAPTVAPTTPNFPTGSYNSAVTQQTIHQTICVRGYTKTIRVRLSTRQGYQHDHFIPLELGGNPTDPNNLWFVPIDRAHKDDQEENELHREVCAGKITLREAQNEMIQWKEH